MRHTSDSVLQRKFRDAVLIRLSRIEAIANLTHAAVIGTFHYNDPRDEEKLMEDAKHAEQFISERSQEMGLAMINYICGEADHDLAPALDPRPGLVSLTWFPSSTPVKFNSSVARVKEFAVNQNSAQRTQRVGSIRL